MPNFFSFSFLMVFLGGWKTDLFAHLDIEIPNNNNTAHTNYTLLEGKGVMTRSSLGQNFFIFLQFLEKNGQIVVGTPLRGW